MAVPAPPAAASKPSSGLLVWSAVTTAIAVVAAFVAFVGVFTPGRSNAAGGGTEQAASGGGGATTFDIVLGEMFIRPNKITVPAGKALTLHVKNMGAAAHNLTIDNGVKTGQIEAGKGETLHVPAMSASTLAYCTVAGHRAAGMEMAIEVAGTTAAASSGGGGMAGMNMASGASSAGAASDDAKIDFNATPAADWKPFDPALKPAPGGTEHKITLRAKDVVKEIAPGVKQQLWTFDGQVPGPILRGKVGDLFTVTLVNDGTIEHSVDFHASKVAWSDEMRSIKPGESLKYQFTADYAGIFMYHCGTAPALHHIGNGMYGALIVDPPVLAPVAHEYVLVQSEFYTGPSGQPGDLAKMQQGNFDAVVFNGYVNQYKYSPIRVEPNERVRVWVLDAGPNENSAFHIVGTIFDTVFKEGTYLLQPDARRGGSQVLDLQPAQGGFVEFSLAEKGFYPIVTHKFANVGKGAMGLFQAGDAKMPANAAH